MEAFSYLTLTLPVLTYRAIALVMLWSNVWLILLPLISFAFRLLKYVSNWLQWFITTGYQEKFSEELAPIRTWCGQRLDVILPAPIRGMTKFILKGDNKVSYYYSRLQQRKILILSHRHNNTGLSTKIMNPKQYFTDTFL